MLAVVWHYWVGVAVFLGGLGVVVPLIVGYFKSVESTRHPKER